LSSGQGFSPEEKSYQKSQVKSLAGTLSGQKKRTEKPLFLVRENPAAKRGMSKNLVSCLT